MSYMTTNSCIANYLFTILAPKSPNDFSVEQYFFLRDCNEIIVFKIKNANFFFVFVYKDEDIYLVSFTVRPVEESFLRLSL